MNSVLDSLLQLVQDVDPILRVLIAAAGMFFETSILLGLIVPGDSIVIVASTAVSGVVEYTALVIGVVVGSLAGETVGFTLGHYFGPRIRHSRLGRRLGEKNWVRAESYLQRRGGPAVFLSRFLPVLHSLIPITVGAGEMRYRRFIAWTAPACVVWALAYVSVGTFAAGSYRKLSDSLHSAGYVFAAIIVLFLIVAIVVRRILHRREERHMGHDESPRRPEAS